jgi:hypothetical protein
MKKIFLLGLVAIGMGATTMSARANGFGVTVALGRPCVPVCVGATLPIVAPPPFVAVGCEPTVIVRGYDRCFVPERFHHPVVERRDFRFHR